MCTYVLFYLCMHEHIHICVSTHNEARSVPLYACALIYLLKPPQYSALGTCLCICTYSFDDLRMHIHAINVYLCLQVHIFLSLPMSARMQMHV